MSSLFARTSASTAPPPPLDALFQELSTYYPPDTVDIALTQLAADVTTLRSDLAALALRVPLLKEEDQ